MKEIAIITVALMMTAPVTFALPAAADHLKVGTSVERDAHRRRVSRSTTPSRWS